MIQAITEILTPETIQNALQGLNELIKREQDVHAATMLEAARITEEIRSRRDVILRFIEEAGAERKAALTFLLNEISQASQQRDVEKYAIAVQGLVGHLRRGLLEQMEQLDARMRDGSFQFSLGSTSNEE